MKLYRCPKVMCELYGSCTLNRMIPASEQSDPDGDTGEILYFAACPELGETFCDLHEDSLVDVPDAPSEHYSEEDAKSAFAMMNHMLEQAIEYLDFPILHGVVKHGPTKWVVPRERIDMLKELVPHQADEIETTFARISETGFEPHEFLVPGEAFMDTALCPFTEDFFAYRKRTGDYYYSDKEEQGVVNGNRAKYRVAWDELMRALDKVLPAKSSVVRLQSTVKGLLQLFESRLSLGVDAVSKADYDHALVVLKEKLCDVAADLRELNLTRKREAEAKRQARAAKRLGLTAVSDRVGAGDKTDGCEGLPMAVADRTSEDNALVDRITEVVTAQADRTIRAFNKGQGVTNSLIKHTWGEAGESIDKRPRSERIRIDKVVRMYVKKHDIEGNTNASLLWCCKEVLKSAHGGCCDEKEVKKLHNTASYDIGHFYDMSALESELRGEAAPI